ncbi:MAG: hypothetical protein ABIG96_00640 [Candidatus Micrarchaeota archaeon]
MKMYAYKTEGERRAKDARKVLVATLLICAVAGVCLAQSGFEMNVKVAGMAGIAIVIVAVYLSTKMEMAAGEEDGKN